ncbi:hypothetical protein CP980_01565 [Streptomyces vinaceus]|uniref:Uncharacterized protein n=2 Tax=Streptomyces vinaceus TaxID=1960 RepID=A0A5J6J1D4_STRVI|nr:hypothetical protein CP980_01565 [Streptomyces vinaceus]GHE74645.1 hypothetical protein GCM10017778_70250 [Streptomyces vinaceus]
MTEPHFDHPSQAARRPPVTRGRDRGIDRMLSHAAAGRRVSLVWLDIKDPNHCGEQETNANAVGLVRDWLNRHDGTHRMAARGDRLFR